MSKQQLFKSWILNMTWQKMPKFFLNRRAFTLTEIAIVIGVAGTILGGIWVAYGQVSQNKKVNKTVEEIRFIVNKIHSLSAINGNVLNVGATDGGCWGNPNPAPTVDRCNPLGATAPCGPPPACLNCVLVPGNPTPPPYSTPTVSMGDPTCVAAISGIFPSEMLSGPPACPTTPVVSSPWGVGDVILSALAVSDACTVNNVAAGGAVVPGTPGYVTPTISYQGVFIINFTKLPVAACIKILTSSANELANMEITKLTVGGYGSHFVSVADAQAKITPDAVRYWCTAPGTSTVSLNLNFPTQITQ